MWNRHIHHCWTVEVLSCCMFNRIVDFKKGLQGVTSLQLFLEKISLKFINRWIAGACKYAPQYLYYFNFSIIHEGGTGLPCLCECECVWGTVVWKTRFAESAALSPEATSSTVTVKALGMQKYVRWLQCHNNYRARRLITLKTQDSKQRDGTHKMHVSGSMRVNVLCSNDSL